MYTEGNSPLHRLSAWPLNAVSLVFKTLSLLNLKRKSRKQARFPGTVIVSIDNLSFGGTGKTTLVLDIGKHLEKRNSKFAIVTRGYRSEFENEGTLVQPTHSTREVGDEAKLFKERFPRQDIYIGKNRITSIAKAISGKNKVILLDDGFQSTDIFKDIKIMLVNPQHPYYYLRNFKFLMKQEDYVLYYRPEAADGGRELFAAQSGSPGKPVYGQYNFHLEGFCTATGNPIPVGDEALLGFSALGDNARFKNDLSAFHLVGFRGFHDHHAYTKTDLERLKQERIRTKADYLVCTEKDFIKIKHFNLSQIPLIYSQNSIKFNFDLMGRVLNDAETKNKV